jgi:hypothetical protein
MRRGERAGEVKENGGNEKRVSAEKKRRDDSWAQDVV